MTKFIIGRYRRPRKEERIILFMDMKGLTAIAEKLGHHRYRYAGYTGLAFSPET